MRILVMRLTQRKPRLLQHRDYQGSLKKRLSKQLIGLNISHSLRGSTTEKMLCVLFKQLFDLQGKRFEQAILTFMNNEVHHVLSIN